MREELSKSPELVAAGVPSLSDELSRLAEISPTSAVLEAFSRIEVRLAEVLVEADVPFVRMSAKWMAREARSKGLISDETFAAVDGLAVLRNLAAHSPRDEIDTARSRDYLTLAEAVLFALHPKPDGAGS